MFPGSSYSNKAKTLPNNLLLRVRFLTAITILLLSVSTINASGTFPINDSSLLIGTKATYTINNKETLIELARDYNLGYNEITAANQDTDPWVPDTGTEITIPSAWLLPEVLKDGIVINLAEMRLYYFFMIEESRYVKTYPIGIGQEGWNTPTGKFTITARVEDPVWTVPESIRKEEPELPRFVPPGPDNPLGGYWLQLSVKGYGIHGTNRPYGIGRRVSHGCMRLYPKDIKDLHDSIKSGIAVTIINKPVKTGLSEGNVYIEVHKSNEEISDLVLLATMDLSRKNLLKIIDTGLFIQAIKDATGLPTVISK